MRSWSLLAGLLLSLAVHGALALRLATVWVGEPPPPPALPVDLAMEVAGGPARDDRLAGGPGDPGGAERRREGPRPAAPARAATQAPVLTAPSAPPVAALPAPVSPSLAAPSAAPSPPVATPSPPPPLAVEPEPVPVRVPSRAPLAWTPPETAHPPPPAPAPAPPLATPPPAAVLDVPHPVPVAPAPPQRPPGGSTGSTAPVPAPGGERTAPGTVGSRDARAAEGAAAGVAGAMAPGPGAGEDAGSGHAGATGRGPASDAPGSGASEGGPLALAVPGTGVGDAAGAEYRAYYEGIRRLIRDSLRYPLAARRQGLSGTVEVELEVRPGGTVGAVAIVRSSSHRVLDDAALEAVRALPRMPFPPGVQPRSLRVRIPVDFELR